MLKKFRAILLLIISIFLVACSQEETMTSTKPPLLVGMEAGYPPYNWTQSNNSNDAVRIQDSQDYANGYDVQIARKIGEALDREIIIVKTEWEGLLPAIQSEKIDLIIAGMSPTPDRKEVIDFSDSYYDVQFAMVTKKDSPYAQAKSIEDFGGAVVTGQLGTLHYDLLNQIPNATVDQAMKSFSAMRVALQSGKIDAYVSEIPEAISATDAISQFTYVVPEPSFEVSEEDVQIGIGVKKGREELLTQVNEVLADISTEERAEIMNQAIKEQPSTGESDFFGNVWNIFKANWPAYLRGTINTLVISLTGTIIGLLIGLLVGIVRTIPKAKTKLQNGLLKFANWFLNAYISIFRGTPMIVQAMVVYYGTSILWNWNLTPLSAAFFIVSINTGAYISEVVRGGILSIDKGQFEAARAIGMSHWQTMKEVVMPQVIRNILPSVGNEFVINVKDTSVLNVISVNELYFTSSTIAGNSFRYFETFVITAIIYFVLTVTITAILRAIENKMDGPKEFVLVGGNQEQVKTLKGE
ncbi:ABC transporter substrate-binding protein/permease [Globicatella sulfidifaciens]|uniref:Amino acid ABC transporter substrate-binding protein, PAAT family (TC 3.A.1.3.-)/amino acid ABC transporter membrane protein, PAAT family (TC 3.A.1.3.-) n=1 Tax=Globicatella sulfidifaciens DSM 15739 TaxID=1121925 RepID=A0A1T4NNY3_9LACT|nr:ABC transporter substrate-binding protein/permease [Globicatella sulfidifaciens]SJZ81030.1 amino acid ABC transporter substrate-binding protein, PAAT family (TC 3.A.1.3.-)/amino acid ABC transporter membrane protein, PAAT family (TC 3.A.1.3.-) [Globicatella sulfidifaciens DSM 15739]